MDDEMKTRICSKCGEEKELSEEFFYRTPHNRTGFLWRCKQCLLLYASDRSKKYRDKIRQKKNEYYANNREKILENQKTYRDNNREKIREAKKRERAKNAEKYKKRKTEWLKKNGRRYRMEYRKRHGDKVREYYRIRAANNSRNISDWYVKRLLSRFPMQYSNATENPALIELKRQQIKVRREKLKTRRQINGISGTV